jgi:hypothetical protein
MSAERRPPQPNTIPSVNSHGSGERPRVAAPQPGEQLDLSPERQRAVDELFDALAGMSLYEVLGVSPDADAKEIRRAYTQRVFEYHPDRHFRKNLGPFKDKMHAIYLRVSEANEVLSDAERRDRYDAMSLANARAPSHRPAPRASAAPAPRASAAPTAPAPPSVSSPPAAVIPARAPSPPPTRSTSRRAARRSRAV